MREFLRIQALFNSYANGESHFSDLSVPSFIKNQSKRKQNFATCLWAFHRSMFEGFPGGVSGKEPACQYRRHKRSEFNLWVGKMPWRCK